MYFINYFVYVHFRVKGTTRKAFVPDVIKTSLVN
jgi:hypothetical protein